MKLRCVLSNEVFYLELVQIANSLLTGGHKCSVHSCEKVTIIKVSSFRAVCEQPAGTIELCVAATTIMGRVFFCTVCVQLKRPTNSV